MPWKDLSIMEQRHEFVRRAQLPGSNRRALCREFGISPKTGYKWLARDQASDAAGLADHSRRPQQSPRRTPEGMETAILALRDQTGWGGRKLRRRLQDLGRCAVPSASTITAILRRHGRRDPAERVTHRPYQRFAYAEPNGLWQMDFKGYRHLTSGTGSCHPLSVLDDASRYLLTLTACGDQRTSTVQSQLIRLFREVGLPQRLLTDNGPPWGSGHLGTITVLEVWLLRLGIDVLHGRPWHPQTQGKVERIHRTLSTELGNTWVTTDLAASQAVLSGWQTVYNQERPHEALGLAVPASRYVTSSRPYPEVVPDLDYGPGAIVRKVQIDGSLHYEGRTYQLSRGLRGQPLAIRPSTIDGVWQAVLASRVVGWLDLRHPRGTHCEGIQEITI